jgi:hypothetical protein
MLGTCGTHRDSGGTLLIDHFPPGIKRSRMSGATLVHTSEISIIAGTLSLMKTSPPPTFRHTGISAHLRAFNSRTFNSFLAPFLQAERVNVNLSHGAQFLPCVTQHSALCFHAIGIGKRDAMTNRRRSGAQRGALEDKLRPEVFLDAPCIFPSALFHLADGRPPPKLTVGR